MIIKLLYNDNYIILFSKLLLFSVVSKLNISHNDM